jgi:hypothetical protein
MEATGNRRRSEYLQIPAPNKRYRYGSITQQILIPVVVVTQPRLLVMGYPIVIILMIAPLKSLIIGMLVAHGT